MVSRVPSNFDLKSIYDSFPVSYEDSINMILRLEVQKYNSLLNCIRHSLKLLEQALSGQIVMSLETEAIFNSILKNEVPDSWLKVSYPSLCTLRGYLKNLKSRVEFFKNWVKKGSSPDQFWLGGFFFPQSFLTSILQNFARSKGSGVTVEQVEFSFQPLKNGFQESEYQDRGVIVNGIHIECARWDLEKGLLTESKRIVHRELLPPMLVEPVLKSQVKEDEEYHYFNCPIYQTEERKGDILPTGHSTNYVFDVRLPSDKSDNHWIRRGVAGILNLKDN